MSDSYFISKTERHELYRIYLAKWLSPTNATWLIRSRWHSHRQIQRAENPCRNLHGFNEAFMQISLVATHKLAGGLNPRLSTVSTFSWGFWECYSLIEILMLTTKVCFDSHAFRWAKMSFQFSRREWLYPAFVLYSEGVRSFTKVLQELFRYFKGTSTWFGWISPSSFSSNFWPPICIIPKL